MAIDYFISLTDGDSFSTYDIYYDAISVSNLCTFTTGGTAINISYQEMVSGVSVVVPDATTQLIIEGNGVCQNYLYLQVTPPTPVEEPPNICLVYLDEYTNQEITYRVTLTPDGTLNGRTKWTGTVPNNGTTLTVRWNLTANQWEITNGIVNYLILTSNSTVPLGTWISNQPYILEGTTTEGDCPAISAVLINRVETVDTLCADSTPCTGKIIVTATGGVPPYQYATSFVPGNPGNVVWSNSNIIQGLCASNFNVAVKDSVGQVSQPSQVTISYIEQPVTYNVGWELTNSITYEDTYQPRRRVSKVSEYKLTTDNQIPAGVSLNLRIQIIETLSRYEPSGFFSYGIGTNLLKNQSTVTPTSQTTSVVTTPRNGCTNFNVVQNIYSHIYDVTYTQGDVITIGVGGNLECDVITSDGCSTILEHKYNTVLTPSSSVAITGCQCCEVTFEKSSELLNYSTR